MNHKWLRTNITDNWLIRGVREDGALFAAWLPHGSEDASNKLRGILDEAIDGEPKGILSLDAYKDRYGWIEEPA